MTAVVHQPVIQSETDEVLANCATKPSIAGAGFNSNVFVVPKHMGGLHTILKS